MNAPNASFFSSQWQHSASSFLLRILCIEHLALQSNKNGRPIPYTTLGLCISEESLFGP